MVQFGPLLTFSLLFCFAQTKQKTVKNHLVAQIRPFLQQTVNSIATPGVRKNFKRAGLYYYSVFINKLLLNK